MFSSSFKQIKRILDINEMNLMAACTILNIPSLDGQDYAFLNEYMKVIRPIAECLKELEGNRKTFGIYLPTLFGLKFKLEEMSKEHFKFCQPLLENISSGFNVRFGEMMDLNNVKSLPLYIAMATNPHFKLNFMPKQTPLTVLKRIQNIVIKAAEEIIASEGEINGNSSKENGEFDDVDANGGKISATDSNINCNSLIVIASVKSK